MNLNLEGLGCFDSLANIIDIITPQTLTIARQLHSEMYSAKWLLIERLLLLEGKNGLETNFEASLVFPL